MINILASVRENRHTVILSTLGFCLLVAVVLSLTIGAVSIPANDVVILLLKKIGLFATTEVDGVHEVVLYTIRLPRIFLTVLIGAALSASGAALQGLFRNPLVEPSLVGVSGGSAAAVVLIIVFGGSITFSAGWLNQAIFPLVAFSGGLLATLVVLKLSDQSGKTNVAMLVLIGVAVTSLSSAIIGLAIFHADENQLRTFTFWTLGDLGGATWDKLMVAAPLLIFSFSALLFFTNALNALALGEAEAFHMGVPVERIKLLIILCSALGVGVSVSMAGMIGFVGLVVPHLIRVTFHADHRLVLPASILGGALLLILADLIARTIVSPAELPIGVVTSLLGAPFFIALLLNAKNKGTL
jgi:iron complex transport system permease protein